MAEALRLADELDDIHTTHVARNAAAELRRLHAENECIRSALNGWIRENRPGGWIDNLRTQRNVLLEALKEYGWHSEDCPQYPTHARPKNWPACTCGFDAAIKAVEGEK